MYKKLWPVSVVLVLAIAAIVAAFIPFGRAAQGQDNRAMMSYGLYNGVWLGHASIGKPIYHNFGAGNVDVFVYFLRDGKTLGTATITGPDGKSLVVTGVDTAAAAYTVGADQQVEVSANSQSGINFTLAIKNGSAGSVPPEAPRTQ